jgi:hypothetical protein
VADAGPMIEDLTATRPTVSSSTKIITYDPPLTGSLWTIVDPSDGPTDQRIKTAEPGAIPGASSHSRLRTTTDAHGAQTPVPGVKAGAPDQSGRLVETYGSKIGECQRHIACPPAAYSAIQNVSSSQEAGLLIGLSDRRP